MHAATIHDAGGDDKLMFFFHGPNISKSINRVAKICTDLKSTLNSGRERSIFGILISLWFLYIFSWYTTIKRWLSGNMITFFVILNFLVLRGIAAQSLWWKFLSLTGLICCPMTSARARLQGEIQIILRKHEHTADGGYLYEVVVAAVDTGNHELFPRFCVIWSLLHN